MKSDRRWWNDGRYEAATLDACQWCGQPAVGGTCKTAWCATYPEWISLRMVSPTLIDAGIVLTDDQVRCRLCGVHGRSRSTLINGYFWHECPPGWYVSESVGGDNGPYFCCSIRCLHYLRGMEE